MKKMYQVFISSTFEDLQNERLKILNALLSFSCIPAGMELFSAASEEQFEYIKKVIDKVDYYILIVAGRYGSVARDGKSYTEKEFDYAQKKGIPILIFLHKYPENLPAKYTEQTEVGKEKLIRFKEKVSKDRMVAFWSNADELATKVIGSLQEEIRNNPQNGWVREEDKNVEMGSEETAKSRYPSPMFSAKILYKMYKKRIMNLSKQIESMRNPNVDSENLINISEHSANEIVKACYVLSQEHNEALIAIEKMVPLDENIETGIDLDAIISSQLIINIFEKNTPLHDGAIIIRDNRIVAGTCYLTVSENPIYWNMSHIHRAAVGMSEVSDCMVLVVSEITRDISFAYNGRLYHSSGREKLVKTVIEYFGIT